jgi:immune inhibitor A
MPAGDVGGPKGRQMAIRRFMATGLLLPVLAGSALALGIPPDVGERLGKAGQLSEVVVVHQAARDSGVADRERSASLWIGPAYNMRGRLPSRIPVILVDFPDQRADRTAHTRRWFESLLFSEGEDPIGSFRDYYKEISYGSFDVTGPVVGWYTMPQSLGFYTAGAYGLSGYPRNAQRLAEDAIRAADADVNFALFDNDGPDGLPDSGDDDGVLDGVLVIHAGPAGEGTADKGDVWSHQWSVRETVRIDGIRAGLYFTVAEDARVGVICHEFGHILGLMDLYDGDYDGAGLGWWSLMAYGSWSMWGMMPPHPDAWSRARLGFVTPLVPNGSPAEVEIPPVETSPVVYKLWTNGAGTSEYFLVENRRKVGFDQSLPSEGLLIYHVDESVSSNMDALHYRVALEQADGLKHLEGGFWRGNLGDLGDPFPGVMRREVFSGATEPGSRAYNLVRTGVAVRGIRSDGLMSTATLETAAAPAPEPIELLVEDADGDGCLAPGESGRLSILISNSGEAGQASEAEVASLSPSLVLEGSVLAVPALPPGPAEVRSASVGATAAAAAFGIADVKVTLRTGPEAAVERIFELGLARPADRSDLLEEREGWTNVAYPSSPLLWEFDAGGDSPVWRLLGGYRPHVEGVITSPAFLVPRGSQIRFAYLCALPSEEEAAGDGVEVEGSLNGGAWHALAPVATPEWLVPGNPATPLAGRLVLADSTDGWDEACYELGAGGAWRVRLRFGSDGFMNGGSFMVDDMRAGLALTPVAAAVNASRVAGGIEIVVAAEDGEQAFVGAAFERRARAEDGFARLHDGWIRFVGGKAVFLDATASSGSGYAYRADVLTREGGVLADGALSVTNPFGESAVIRYSVPPGRGDFDVRVYDVRGREVSRICHGAAGAGRNGTAVWSGRDATGRPVPAGIYLVRLKAGGRTVTAKAVRLP